jgi:hypothetical protein
MNASYLMERTDMGPSERCWRWRLGHGLNGRPVSNTMGRWAYAYVLWWELFFGAIPNHGRDANSMTIDHTCNHVWCVNPYHLRLLTLAENMREHRSRNPRQGSPGRYTTKEMET